MIKAKVIGAGSVGNHLTQACRRAGWDVTVVDTDPNALKRMKEDTYPKRYGTWDEAIKLYASGDEPKGRFDVIFIGTPPHVRMSVAKKALDEEPRVLQLEKPLCQPTADSGLAEFLDAYGEHDDTVAVVGYDHVLAESVEFMADLLRKKSFSDIETLDVEFREHWQGIFAAHPWLFGPQDTYLGYWKKGGGASGEHSHALHMWQFLARTSGLGKWEYASSFMDMKMAGEAAYDSLAAFSIFTDNGRVGRVVQDVVTLPARKWARAQGTNGFIEWHCNGHPDGDLVKYRIGNGEIMEKVFPKKRPDDFYREILHIKDILDGRVSEKKSPIALETGVSVMRFLELAHKNRNKSFTV